MAIPDCRRSKPFYVTQALSIEAQEGTSLAQHASPRRFRGRDRHSRTIMTRTFSVTLSAAAIAAALAFGSGAAFAQAKTAKACEEEWTAKKAELQKAKTTKKDFMAQCRTAPAAAAPAAPAPAAAKPAAAPAPATAAKPAPAPAAAKPMTAPASTSAEPAGKPGREAMVARERACGADWKADKAAGKTAGLTWPKYWSECDKRKKAQGM
jgi:hypothetical protein